MADQANIDQLVQELKDFNRVMGDHVKRTNTGNTGNTSTTTDPVKAYDKSSAKIVTALGILNTSILGTAKNNVTKNAELKKFSQAVDKSTDDIKKAADSAEALAAANKEAVRVSKLSTAAREAEDKAKADSAAQEASKKAAEAKADRVAAANRTRDEFERTKRIVTSGNLLEDRFGSMGNNGIVLEATLGILTNSFNGLVKGITSYTGAIYNGQRGLEVSAKATNEVMNGVAEGLGNLVSVLGFFTAKNPIVKGLIVLGGQLIPKIVSLFGGVSEKAAKQLDTLFNSFNQLSSVGGTTAGGLEEVRKAAQQLGFSMSEMEAYNKLILGNAKDIKAFGTTVADGGRRFGKLTDELYNGPFGRGLQNLGVQLEEQRESALAFMTIQARSGQLNKMRDEQLVAGTAAFVKELDLAATLTGSSRKEQQEARLNAQADAQLRAAQRIAEAKGDQKRIAYLKTMADYAAMVEPYSKEGAAGIRRFGAGGYAAGEGAVQSSFMFGTQKIRGGESPEQMAKMLSAAIGQNQRMFDVINQYSPTVSGVQIDPVASANLKQNIDAAIEGATKTGKSITEILQEKEKGSPTLKLMNDTNRAQIKTAINLDSAIGTFDTATKIYASASKELEAASAALKEFLTGGSPGPTTPPAPVRTPLGTNRMPGANVPSGQPVPSSSGASGGQSSSAGGQSSSAGGAAIDYSGLRIKSEESIGGGNAQPALVNLARTIQDKLGGDLRHFSAFNDRYHQGLDRSSAHTSGHALDFSLNDRKNSPMVTAMVRGLPGVKSVRDEYVNPSPGSTGGHIHTEIHARNGFSGMLSGPESGYKPDITMHGPEKLTITPQNNSPDDKMVSLLATMIDRCDTMINLLDDGNGYSKKLVSVMS